MMHLFKQVRGFIPYLLIVFLNAFVDLGHKIVIQNTVFKAYDGDVQIVLTAIVNALILLPFILLFSPSGFLSDRFSKVSVMRWGAALAVVATALITVCYYQGWFWAAFGLTLLLAVQSALYSPAKYGYIRELVGDEKLAEANAVVQATTIVSILAGTFVFSILFEMFLPTGVLSQEAILQHIRWLGWVLVALSTVEFVLTYALSEQKAGDTTQQFDIKAYVKGRYLRSNIQRLRKDQVIWLSIIGLSVFWAISQVMLAAFPAYAKVAFSETNTVVIQGLLACSGIGIVLGSVVAGRLSRAHIELGLIPVGAVGIFIGLLCLPVAESAVLVGINFMLIGLAGGVFIVPLNSLIQYHAKDNELGMVLAGNNWVQNIAMLSFLLATTVLASLGMKGELFFYLLAAVALIGAGYTVKQLPHSFARIIASVILKRKYRIDVEGFENLPKEGGVLLLGNHISWIDWAFVQIASPRPVRFVMLRSYYDLWYLRPFLKFFGAIPISPGNSRTSLDTVNQCLKNGEVVCLFPEGALSRNGQLGVFRSGYERAVEGVDGVIVPFYLRGLWGSWLSRSATRTAAKGLKRDIIVAFGETLPITTRADALKQKVAELSVDAWEAHTNTLDPVPLAWLKTAKSQLGATAIIDDMAGTRLTQAKLIAAVSVFTQAIRRQTRGESCVGLLLPSSAAATITNMAVMMNGQTAVNINYTASAKAVASGIEKAGVRTVFTSERFVKKLVQKGMDVDAMLADVEVVYLEPLKAGLPAWKMAMALVAAYSLPASWIYRLYGRSAALGDTAQILFSSGSEGCPKGIQLTHQNLMGNIKQISEVLDTRDNDVIMANLPPFHSFGLTVTTLLPLVEGLPAVCQPDPTDALATARSVARHEATIMCGTSTFLGLYTRNRKVLPLMFSSLRIVVAGAERLSDEVREQFALKFNKPIYEGYGATETTPVASVNVPDKLDVDGWQVQVGQKPGTVGLPLPGSCFRIVDPETLATLPAGEDGLILISGCQVMQGYLHDEAKTQEALVALDGRRWYKTGDKGHLDSDGFLSIVDRYSRFAKVGGEMISLGAVEQAVVKYLALDESVLAATHIKDEKKGEKVILLVEAEHYSDDLRQQLIDAGMSSLMLPAEVRAVDGIPRLGSGKTDFAALKRLAG